MWRLEGNSLPEILTGKFEGRGKGGEGKGNETRDTAG